MNVPRHPDLLRLAALAEQLGCGEVSDDVAELLRGSDPVPGERLRGIGRSLLTSMEGRLEQSPPELPESTKKASEVLRTFDALVRMERHELSLLDELAARASAEAGEAVAALPDALLAGCRQTVASLVPHLAGRPRHSRHDWNRLLRLAAFRLRREGLEATDRIRRKLDDSRLQAVEALLPLALTWSRLIRVLADDHGLADTPAWPPLLERLREARREVPEPADDAKGEPAAELFQVLGLGTFRARLLALAAEPPEDLAPERLDVAALRAIHRVIEVDRETWQATAERALREHLASRFDHLACELDLWSVATRQVLEIRCGLDLEAARELDAARREIADLCDLGAAS